MRARRRGGFTLLESLVSLGIVSLVLYIIAAAVSLARGTLLADDLAHAAQAATVLAARIEADLAQAIRDPETGEGVRVAEAGYLMIQFFRCLPAPGGSDVVVVPVRWVMLEDTAAGRGTMVRTTWDPAGQRWLNEKLPWAPISLPLPDGASADASDLGFAFDGDATSRLQSLKLSVLARRRGASGPGAGQDRATVQIAVAVPDLPAVAAKLFVPVKTMEEMPPAP